jgi:hypothetical protein
VPAPLTSVLVEAGHRLARLDERWKKLARKLRAKGKAGSAVAAASPAFRSTHMGRVKGPNYEGRPQLE